jgi:hypothetical protein
VRPGGREYRNIAPFHKLRQHRKQGIGGRPDLGLVQPINKKDDAIAVQHPPHIVSKIGIALRGNKRMNNVFKRRRVILSFGHARPQGERHPNRHETGVAIAQYRDI